MSQLQNKYLNKVKYLEILNKLLAGARGICLLLTPMNQRNRQETRSIISSTLPNELYSSSYFFLLPFSVIYITQSPTKTTHSFTEFIVDQKYNCMKRVYHKKKDITSMSEHMTPTKVKSRLMSLKFLIKLACRHKWDGKMQANMPKSLKNQVHQLLEKIRN